MPHRKQGVEPLSIQHLLDRYQIARRLSDLEFAGKVEKGKTRMCMVGDRNAVEWLEFDTSRIRPYKTTLKPVVINNKFRDMVIFLDCEITLHNYKDAKHSWSSQTWMHTPLDWVFNGEYYLSDGGYSRMVFSEISRELFLTSNSRKEVKCAWNRCKELRADIETEINNAVNAA